MLSYFCVLWIFDWADCNCFCINNNNFTNWGLITYLSCTCICHYHIIIFHSYRICSNFNFIYITAITYFALDFSSYFLSLSLSLSLLAHANHSFFFTNKMKYESFGLNLHSYMYIHFENTFALKSPNAKSTKTDTN